MKLRILDILKENKVSVIYSDGLSLHNFNKMINNQTSGIKLENIQSLCDVLECTPNELFEEYYKK